MTENTVLAFLLLFSLVSSLYLLVNIWLTKRDIKYLRDIKYKTITQRDFGKARQELFVLIGDNELAPDSITFLYFYLYDSFVMRNPDKYRSLAKLLRENFFLDKKHRSETFKLLTEESENWSRRVKEMVDMNVSAINSLLVYHSPTLRIIYLFGRLALPLVKKMIEKEMGLFNYVSHLIAKNNSDMDTFVRSKEGLQKLAQCS
jgi:hypothetical protein